VFDEKLLREEYVFFNPGSHTKSVRINPQALVSFVRPNIADFAN
jgi:prolyl-tRNA editing enzyme YbaK/EbsC (Cys-tRNA(Pro) deacylase)